MSDKDQIIYKWRAGVVFTEESVTTICRFHGMSFSDSFFKKKTVNAATSKTVTKRERCQMEHTT